MPDNLHTLCRFAWDYPVVNISRNELRACCRTAPNTVTPQDVRAYGSKLFSQFEPLVQLKKALLRGERHPACSSCWRIEAGGADSQRASRLFFIRLMQTTNWFGTKNEAEIENRLNHLTDEDIEGLARHLDEPRMLEVALSNTCDLKCVYCNHHYSTQWAAELIKFKEISITQEHELPTPNTEYMDVFWQYFDTVAFKHCEIINFIGGEPLIIDDFYKYANRILDKFELYPNQEELRPYVFLSVVTNLNAPEKYLQKLFELIPRVLANPRLHFEINVSMESLGERAEYIRTGIKWERFQSNVKRLLALLDSFPAEVKPRVHFGFHMALNSLCISTLPETVQFVIDCRQSVELPIRIRPNQVVFPKWLSPQILPPHYGLYLDRAIKLLVDNMVDPRTRYKPDSWVEYAAFLRTVRQGIKHLRKDEEARAGFVEGVEKMKARRGIDFEKTFPEMVPFYQLLKTTHANHPTGTQSS